MKNSLWALLLLLLASAIIMPACNDDDDDPDPVISTTELLSRKVTAVPTMDGNIDSDWNNCQIYQGTATVPTLNDFTYFENEEYDFQLRSMYDATRIYFLLEWDDPEKSEDRESWYFDSAAKLWKQHNKFPQNADDKYYEDKFAFLWPTSTSETTAWNNATCYATCHAMPAAGYSTGTKHYADDGQIVDMWHWKLVRTEPYNQVDDQKIIEIGDLNNPNATEKKDGGRTSDPKTSGGSVDNKQTLNNGTADVSVPKYIIPNKTNYSFISKEEISAGTAKLVTAVNANGVLTYDGGTIDPAAGGYEAGTGAKRFPSVYIDGPLVGSRGDITSYAKHTGSGWVVEVSRALNTGDATNDIQFDPLKTTMFGFAIFENAAIAHGIKPNITLKYAQ